MNTLPTLLPRKKPPMNRNDTIYRGEIVYWNDMKGYGFIKTFEDEPNIFFHISAFAYDHTRPKRGNMVAFLLEKSKDRYQASRIVLEGHENTLFTNSNHDSKTGPYIIETTVYSILVCMFYVILATISIPIAGASIIISILTFALYGLDKHAALTDQQRVPEASLHIAAILGGWPGALIARPLLRHKTSKNRFIIFFWLSVITNFSFIYLIVWQVPPVIVPV